MPVQLKIDFANPVIVPEDVLEIQPSDMDDFYVTATDLDKANLFFMLLTSLHHYEAYQDDRRSAHLSFLAANYLFVALTPPGSQELAMHYIKKALVLYPCEEYAQWLAFIKKGN